MSAFFIEIITTITQLIILIFIIYYLLQVRLKEQALNRKEHKAELAYQHIIDTALAKEKKILDSATAKAEQIIADAQITHSHTKKVLDQTLEKMVTDLKNQAQTTAKSFAESYESSLKKLSDESINDFQSIDKELKETLQKNLKEFHDTQLSLLQKELDEYKQAKINSAEQAVGKVIQKVSKEFLTSTISLEDHQKLLLQSLEKAKKEGLFE